MPMSDANVEEDDDLLDILDDVDGDAEEEHVRAKCWRVLVVDDDQEVHDATRFALGADPIVGRALQLLSAYSAAEGKDVLEANPDIAVVLLDVVMEEHDAGLKFVEWMRARGYQNQRIILRTGQPGYAPELDVVRNYDINDYRSKNELTRTRLITAITAAIRSFQQFYLLEEKRASLEEFSYALAHDFKQTTRQIMVFSGRVIAYFEDNNIEPPQELSFMSGAAKRLGGLVDVMSQYTLLSQQPEIEDVDISSVFEDLRAALQPVLSETGGRLELSGSGACKANAAMLANVLQILASNGLQHNENPSPCVDVSASSGPRYCTIVVRDNGVGIDAAYLEEVFEPHMRLRATTDLPATGLGLTLSRRAVEALGGALWCESEPGSGSAFHLKLPAASAASNGRAVA